MALLHHAEITPSKIEVVSAWAPAQPWFDGQVGAEITKVGAFRLDDPAGQVGLEVLFVRAGDGPVLQVPLTYRDAPLDAGERFLITTMQHSVLGERWVYDATGDPVYLATVALTALTGGRQADEFFETEGGRDFRESTAVAVGSRSRADAVPEIPSASDVVVRHDQAATVSEAGGLQVITARMPGGSVDLRAALDVSAVATEVLTGTWPGHDDPAVLAMVALR